MWIATRLHHRCACHQFSKQFGYRKSSAYIHLTPLYLTNTVLPVWFYQDWHLWLLSRLDHTTATLLPRENHSVNSNVNIFYILKFIDRIHSIHYFLSLKYLQLTDADLCSFLEEWRMFSFSEERWESVSLPNISCKNVEIPSALIMKGMLPNHSVRVEIRHYTFFLSGKSINIKHKSSLSNKWIFVVFPVNIVVSILGWVLLTEKQIFQVEKAGKIILIMGRGTCGAIHTLSLKSITHHPLLS